MVTFTICEICKGEGWISEPYCCGRTGFEVCCGNWVQAECSNCQKGVIIHEQTNYNEHKK